MVRKVLWCITFLLFAFAGYAQIPENFNYQATLRNADKELMTNQDVNLRISLLQGSETGPSVYTETHAVATNDYGLVNLKIGKGTDPSSDFSMIDWNDNNYFLAIEIMDAAGSGYISLGASELQSVPYSIYSNNSINSLYSDTSEIARALDNKILYFSDSDTLFAVKDRDGNIVFAVFPDGAKIYVDETRKRNVGGFAVSGRGTGKGNLDFFSITPDSARIILNENAKGQPGGFAVSGRGTGKSSFNDYFNISAQSSAEVIDPSEPRILWYPKKEAFMAGRVIVESADSVGMNSWATGFESKAIGDYSQALGFQSRAAGDYSSAIGYQALARNTNAFAFGNNAQALGVNSFAFGEDAEAHSSESYSFGRGAKSYGYRSFALGSSGVDSSGAATGVTQAKGNYSFAIGQGSITGIDLADCPPKPPKYPGTQEEYWKIYYSGEGAVAIGVGDSSLASYATTLGYYNTASYGSVALGYKNKSYGMQSAILGGYSNLINSSSSVIAGGHGHIIDAPYAGILGGIKNKVHADAAWGVIGGGYKNEIYGSTSTIVNGTYNITTGALSTVIGSRNNAYSWCETVIGRYNDYDATGNPDNWEDTDHLFVIGNGTADDARSNAMVVLKNGNIGIGADPGTYRLNVTGGNAYFSNSVSALSLIDRTPYPKDLETAYKAVFSMNRLPDGEYDENNKENQLDHSKLHPFVNSADGEYRDLSATVSAQNEVIKDLVKQIGKLKDENELLKQKLNEIIEKLNK
ncbi:MAG: hypothetical protein R6V16_03535 [Bacteroidales bacterium]